MSMNKQVAVIGIGQTRYEIKDDQTIPEMVYEAVGLALRDAGLSIKEINNVVTASVDLWDGLTASNVAIAEVVGAVMKPEARVAADGSLACIQACMSILAGAYETTLVVAHCKGSMSRHFGLTNWTFDPIYQQPLGLDDLAAAALQATAYLHKYGIVEEECAQVVVRCRRKGRNNPYAQMNEGVTVQDVLSSPMLARPITELEAAPVCDGACALVLAQFDRACEISAKPVWIAGMGYCLEEHYLGDRDLTDPVALREAARRAYATAGITEPSEQLDVVELTAPFAHQELLWLEGLGLCGRDEAGCFIETNDIAVNPSGGMLAGNPYFVAGLARVAEAALQLRAEAGARQVENAQRALAHGCWGPAGQGHGVMILKEGL